MRDLSEKEIQEIEGGGIIGDVIKAVVTAVGGIVTDAIDGLKGPIA